MSDDVFVWGECWAGRHQFSYDPDSVAVVLVDPVTGLPPDVPGAPLVVEGTVLSREPLCPECVGRINAGRSVLGLPAVAADRQIGRG